MSQLYNNSSALSIPNALDEMRAAGYYAVIPAAVRYDQTLPPNAKLLYGEISALTSKDGYCYATNQYFATLYQCTVKSISRLVAALENGGYISTVLVKDASGKIKGRNIYLRVSTVDAQPVDNFVHTSGQNCPEGIDKNVQSYKCNNNTDINIKGQKGKKQAETVLRGQFIAWMDERAAAWPDGARERLLTALDGFWDTRAASKKPIRSDRAVTILCNRLEQYSGGDPAIMAAMLDEATLRGWQSVYPPDNGKPNAQGTEVQTEWL